MEYSTSVLDKFIRDSFQHPPHQLGADAKKRLDEAIETYANTIVTTGWERTTAADRKTIRATDIHIEQPPDVSALSLTVAPARKFTERTLPDDAFIGDGFAAALTLHIEEYLQTVVQSSEHLMEHAGRNTLTESDISTYFLLFEDLPQ